jgi:hypothetical protein
MVTRKRKIVTTAGSRIRAAFLRFSLIPACHNGNSRSNSIAAAGFKVEFASASATINALRVGLNIAVGRRRPEVEFYYQVHNEYKPPDEIPEREVSVTKDFKFKTPARTQRWHDIYVSLCAVNIGCVRAENVVFSVTNDFKRHLGREFGNVFKHPVRQMAPGQAAYLFRLEETELFPRNGEPEPDIMLEASYAAAPSWLNWPRQRWARFRKRGQYITTFAFSGRNIATDLPPPTYNG